MSESQKNKRRPSGTHTLRYRTASMFRKGLLLSSDGEHFMDRNRAALVVRMSDTNIMLVMDELLSEKILNDVQYNTVRSNRASHEMMRKLYDYARAWGPNQKDTFISILSKYDKWLILDLMEKENQSLNSSAT
uniref:CARD domain-containing protein n=1 Tax=Xenopus tropicalis TaxID=8364 RepID=A0A1B8Y1K5_XENTR